MSRIIKITAILVLAPMLYGCGSSDRKSAGQRSDVFVDVEQRQVTVSRPVKRIVSMAPNVTEMLFAIGLEQEIVGVTDFCDYPDAAQEKTRIGGYYNPSIEAISSTVRSVTPRREREQTFRMAAMLMCRP